MLTHRHRQAGDRVCKAWQRQRDPVHGPGFSSELKSLEKPGPLPWVQSQAGLMKTRLGWASENIIMDFLENVLKEGNEGQRGSVS